MNITIEEVLSDLQKSNENDAYYYDALNEVGYHIHVNNHNEPISYTKRTAKNVSKITEDVFVEGVNSSCGNAISANSYYEI